MSADKMMEELNALKEGLSKPVESEQSDSVKAASPAESSSEPVMSEAEQQARLRGWRPKEEFKDDPEDWVDAQTFMERDADFRMKEIKKLRKKLEADSKDNAELRKMVGALLDDIKDAENRAREKVLKEIEARKQEAAESNDLRTYRELEAKEAEYKKPEPKQKVDSLSQDAYTNFVAKHNLQNLEDDLAAEKYFFATRTIDKYLKTNPHATQQEQLDIADKALDEKYSRKEEEKEVKPKVGGMSSGSGAKPKESGLNKINESNLSPSQKLIYESLKKDKSYGMSAEDYLKSLNSRNSK